MCMRWKFCVMLSVCLVLFAAASALALGDTLTVAAAYDAKADARSWEHLKVFLAEATR